MNQQRHSDYHLEKTFEEFRNLRRSDYWLYLQPKTQKNILIFLAEYGKNNVEND